MQQQQQQPLGMGLDPATALPTTDTIQAVSEGDVLISLFFFPSVDVGRFVFSSFSLSLAHPQPRPLSPSIHSLPSQFLEDNDRLIGAVSQAYGSGRLDAAAAYQARLHANLTYLAAVADASTPSAAETAANPPQAQAQAHPQAPPPPQQQQQQQQRFHAPVPPHMQQQQQGLQFYQQQQGGAPPPPPRQY